MDILHRRDLGAKLTPLNLPLAPIITAACVAAVMGRVEWKQWTRTLSRWPTSVGWYVLAVVAPGVVIGAAVLANRGFGAPLPTASQLAGWTGASSDVRVHAAVHRLR